jgi:hypothetical protein
MIQIRCFHCDEFYFIQEVRDKNEQASLLRYAVCDKCGTPRNPDSFKTHKKIKLRPIKQKGQCDNCGAEVSNKKWNLCHACYMRVWKKSTNYNTEYMREYRRRKITT